MGEKDYVAPCNLFLQTLFSQVDVYLQQKLVSSGAAGHAYRAMFDTLLNFGPPALESQFQSQLFYKDTGGAMDSASEDATEINQGFVNRQKLTGLSQSVDMEGPVYADLMQMDRYLLKGYELRLKFHQSSDPFRLITKAEKPDFKVVLQDVIFKACMVTVSPEVIMAHAATLMKSPALYPYIRTELKAFAVPKGSYHDLYLGNIPNCVVIAMVTGATYSGSYSLNPFNFQPFLCNFLSVSIDGMSVPGKPLTPKFSKDKGHNYITAYQSLFAGLKKEDLDEGIYTNRLDYGQGYTIYVYDLGAHMDELNFQPALKKGNLKLETRFEKPLNETINILVYANFPSLMRIDQTRNILL